MLLDKMIGLINFSPFSPGQIHKTLQPIRSENDTCTYFHVRIAPEYA